MAETPPKGEDADGGENHSEGWRQIAGDIRSEIDAYSLVGVTQRLVRRPVRGAVELAEDRAYRGHVQFFSAALSLTLAFGLVALPRFTSWYLGEAVEGGDASAAALRTTIIQYLELAVIIPLSFFAFRAVATRQRTPRSYFKLSMIGTGFALLIVVALTMMRWIAIVAINEALPDETASAIVESPPLIIAVSILVILAMIGYLIALNRAFWELRWPATIALSAVLIAADVAINMAINGIFDTDPVQALMKVF